MPEFIAEHVPSGLDGFTTGYLECAEWLADGGEGEMTWRQRERCKGWASTALAMARRDCKAFQKAHADLLTTYYSLGRDEAQAGHDFWLSRNGHGAGFFDRGYDPVYHQLQQAAESYGQVSCEYYRNRLYLNGG